MLILYDKPEAKSAKLKSIKRMVEKFLTISPLVCHEIE